MPEKKNKPCTYRSPGLSVICCIAACFKVQNKRRKDVCVVNQPIHHLTFQHASQVQLGPNGKDASDKGLWDCHSAFFVLFCCFFCIFHMIP